MGVGRPVRGAALAEIESVYRARLAAFHRVAYGVLGDADAAGEAVQDAFASAVRDRGAYRGDGRLEAWLWRLVVNAAHDRSRADRSRGLVARELVARTNGAGSHADADVRVRAAVSRLPERQRLVLFLRYYADLDYSSIAEVTETAPGTVAATLNQARHGLRRLLEEEAS